MEMKISIVHKFGRLGCGSCPSRKKCNTLCTSAELYAGQDNVSEWFLDYSSPRDDDKLVVWSNGLPEIVWEIFEKLSLNERDRDIFILRFGKNEKLNKIANIYGISESMVRKIIACITEMIKNEVRQIRL